MTGRAGSESAGPGTARTLATAPREADPTLGSQAASRRSSRAGKALRPVAFGVVYFCSYLLTTRFRMADWGVPAFYMPSGVLLAALLVVRRRHWWAYLLAAATSFVIFHLLDDRMGPRGILLLPFYFSGTALAAAGIRRYGRAPLLRSMRSMGAHLFFGLVLQPLINVAAIVGIGYTIGAITDPVWCLWHYSPAHMLGSFLTAPPLALGVRYWRRWQRISVARFAEAGLLAVALVVSADWVFGRAAATDLPGLVYLPLPLLLWAAVRFGVAGTGASLLFLAVVAFSNAIHQRGPFGNPSAEASVQALQLLLLALSPPLMCLTATLDERRRATNRLLLNQRALRVSNAEARDLASRLIAAQEAERTRLARELHDDMGQRMAALSIALAALKKGLPGAPEVASRIADLQERAGVLADDMHHLAHGLHPGVLRHAGLEAALRGVAAEFGGRDGVEIRFGTEGEIGAIPDAVGLCLFRVAQEALHNVAKHARARSASLLLSRSERGLTLTVADDGTGFETDKVLRGAGLGLLNLEERVRFVGGKIEIRSDAARGTEVCVSVPARELLPPPRVVLADDHQLVAQGIAGLLEGSCDVVAVADNGESLVASAQRLRPDLVITDLSMPGMGGLEAIRRLAALPNKPGIIVFTMHRDAALAAEAFRAGARGYVLKHSAGTELLSAIDEVIAGRAYVTPQVGQDALGAFGEKAGGLTPRQRDVLRLLAEGLSMKEVAARLDISTRTVETHKYDLMRQLGARSTADLVKHALRMGLIDD